MPDDGPRHEVETSRETIAEYLREVAEDLERGGAVQLDVGNERASVDPPETPTFTVAVDQRDGLLGDDHNVEFGIRWEE